MIGTQGWNFIMNQHFKMSKITLYFKYEKQPEWVNCLSCLSQALKTTAMFKSLKQWKERHYFCCVKKYEPAKAIPECKVHQTSPKIIPFTYREANFY